MLLSAAVYCAKISFAFSLLDTSSQTLLTLCISSELFIKISIITTDLKVAESKCKGNCNDTWPKWKKNYQRELGILSIRVTCSLWLFTCTGCANCMCALCNLWRQPVMRSDVDIVFILDTPKNSYCKLFTLSLHSSTGVDLQPEKLVTGKSLSL